MKSSFALDTIGINIENYRNWIEFQMTPEMNYSNIENDHIRRLICSFKISNDEEMKEAFCWKKTQPLLKEVHGEKGSNYNVLDYQLQFIEAYQFYR